ncbi:MAG: dCMP deaminase family protein [Deltaproteobacteria bacterium]|jgi:dCMP deaminase|nr:dCMP deaminase family protein [Deltaproteobacteria bacterium]
MEPNGQGGPPQGTDFSIDFTFAELLTGRLTPRPDWDQYFMAIAKVVSTRSTCSSRPVGCVITRENRILVTGYNGAPPGEPHCTDMGEPGELFCARRAQMVPDSMKLQSCRSLHAEENALNLADRLGLSDLLKGASVYTTLSPCIRCIEHLKRCGVTKVFFELAYQSVDAQRDRMWVETALAAFEVYRQVSLGSASARKIAGALLGTTSERLLASG